MEDIHHLLDENVGDSILCCFLDDVVDAVTMLGFLAVGTHYLGTLAVGNYCRNHRSNLLLGSYLYHVGSPQEMVWEMLAYLASEMGDPFLVFGMVAVVDPLVVDAFQKYLV